MKGGELAANDLSADIFMTRGVFALEVECFEAVGKGVVADVVEECGREDGEDVSA